MKAALLEDKIFGYLQQLHVLCLPAFGAFDDTELYGLTFLQAAETVCLNRGEMNEHVLAVLSGEKAITFCVIEPLNCSLFHCDARIPCSEFALFSTSAGRLLGCSTAVQRFEKPQAHYT